MPYPSLIGLEHLGMEPDYTAMIISGFKSHVSKSIPKRIQNFIMLRVARNILQVVRQFFFYPTFKKLNITSGNPYRKSNLALHGSFLGLAEVNRIQSDLSSPMIQSTDSWLPRHSSISGKVEIFLKSKDPPVVFFAIGTIGTIYMDEVMLKF